MSTANRQNCCQQTRKVREVRRTCKVNANDAKQAK